MSLEHNACISKEFLERVLNHSVNKFEIHPGANLGDGFSCTLFSIDVWKADETSPPVRILLKCFPSDAARQEYLEASNLFFTEVRMYDSILPELAQFQEGEEAKIQHPCAPFLWANYNGRQTQYNPSENCIVMPDLRAPSNGGFKLWDRFQSFDLDHYSLVIEGQAKLHALSWAYKCKTGISFTQTFPFLETNGDWYKMLDSLLSDSIQISESIVMTHSNVQEGFEKLKKFRHSIAGLYFGFDYGQNSRGLTKDSILKGCPPVQEVEEEPWSVLLHGDTWSNNMLFRYDLKAQKPIEVNFIDFQLVREGDPFSDICYSLFVSTSKNFRQQHLKSMLHLYFDTFASICNHFGVPTLPSWGWEEFQRRFRRATIYGGYMAITCLPIFLKSPDQLFNLENDQDQEIRKNSKASHNDAFPNIHSNTESDSNPILEDRLLGVLEDLVEAGII